MAFAWQAPFALYIQSAALQLETSGISMTSFFMATPPFSSRSLILWSTEDANLNLGEK
jgi:hypothetical protein